MIEYTILHETLETRKGIYFVLLIYMHLFFISTVDSVNTIYTKTKLHIYA